jgi:hypothetical protein
MTDALELKDFGAAFKALASDKITPHIFCASSEAEAEEMRKHTHKDDKVILTKLREK